MKLFLASNHNETVIAFSEDRAVVIAEGESYSETTGNSYTIATAIVPDSFKGTTFTIQNFTALQKFLLDSVIDE